MNIGLISFIFVLAFPLIIYIVMEIKYHKDSKVPPNPIKEGYKLQSEEVQNLLNNNPIEKKIVETVFSAPDDLIKELTSRYNKEVSEKVRIIFRFFTDGGLQTKNIVIMTDKMIFLHNANYNMNRFYFAPNMKNFINLLDCESIIMQDSYQKNSSVIGSAVAGGILAGGVGAVVGAVSAADKNAQGGKTVTGPKYDTGRISMRMKYIGRELRQKVWYVYLNNKLSSIEKLPDLGNGSSVYNSNSFRRYEVDRIPIFSLTVSQFNEFKNFLLKVCEHYDQDIEEKNN